MIIAIVPVIVTIVGVLAYALASNAKIAEIGRLAYACGLLVTLFTLASKVIRL